ncbi:MAG TPA: hypothetical protein VG013_21145 [Gemmataceae bacterium]|jgi:hypothetical protein|nr:hypothetical protein [Gemmataceae bacterium]
MDTHAPCSDGDLNDVERRLAAWRPSADGLHSDAMLFAAGRASARADRGRFVWPVMSACTALLAAALGVWVGAERAERLALAQQIRQQPPAPAPTALASAAEPQTADPPAPNSYLANLRALERDPEAWAANDVVKAGPLPGPPSPGHRILQAWRPGETLEP